MTLVGEARCGVNELVYCSSKSSGDLQEVVDAGMSKRPKLSVVKDGGGGSSKGQHKVSHITVERNRRKQMSEHLNVLISLTPSFYVKRGDQASVVGGVINYITELHRILKSVEAKKQRKVYGELALSHRIISPRRPQPTSPYQPILPQLFIAPSLDISPANSFTNSDISNEPLAYSRSPIAEVEVKFAGGNLLLKTRSHRLMGQTTKVIEVLENLCLEILEADIRVVDETMVNSFILKIGIECQLSAEELAQHIQKAFC